MGKIEKLDSKADLAMYDFCDAQRKYVDLLRQYSLAQVEYWQQYPYLQLLTDERFDPSLELPPYVFGYYPTKSTKEDDALRYRVWVDCATGQLIQQAPFTYDRSVRERNPYRVPFESVPASNHDISRLIPQDLSIKMTVGGIKLKLAQIEGLKQDPDSDREMADHWWKLVHPDRQAMIEKVMRETGLRPIFTRNPLPEISTLPTTSTPLILPES
jgi:hypothetical protein